MPITPERRSELDTLKGARLGWTGPTALGGVVCFGIGMALDLGLIAVIGCGAWIAGIIHSLEPAAMLGARAVFLRSWEPLSSVRVGAICLVVASLALCAVLLSLLYANK